MIITLLNVLLSIFLFIQQVIIFDGFVHIRSHFAHRILCRFFSVEHILNLCFYNRTCFREYTEKCTCIFRCRIMKLVNGCLVSAESQAYWNAQTGYFPVTTAAHDEQVFKDNIAKYPDSQAVILWKLQIRSNVVNYILAKASCSKALMSI